MDDTLVKDKKDLMDGVNEISFAPIAWLGVALTMILCFFSLCFLMKTDWPISAIGMIVTLVGAYLVFWLLTWTYIQRYLADRGWFWLRVPEMKAAFVEKDRGLYKIFVNVSGELRDHFQQLAADKNAQAGYERMIVLGSGKQIVWVGLPWISRLKTPWYEHNKDRTNKDVDPLKYLDLKERVIEYKGGEGGVIPNVDTSDPIQVSARVVVSLRVFDPEKALYSVEFFMEAVQNEIAARWRKAVVGLSYFQVAPASNGTKKEVDIKDIDTLKINPHIQKQIHENFICKVLKIAQPVVKTVDGKEIKEEDNYKNYLPKVSFDTTTGKLDYADDFPDPSPARDILHNWGIVLLHVEVRDLDPMEDVRKALEKRSTVRVQAAAALQEAEGKAAARKKEGEGERVYKEEVAKGNKAQAQEEREGVAEGLKAIAKAVTAEGGNAALAADTAVRVAGGTDNMITEGGLSGFVGQLAKVAEAMKPKKTEDIPSKT